MWLDAFISGLLFSLSLIVVIGAQNAYVLRQGARRERVATVVFICALSDAFLIGAGVAGMGTVVRTDASTLTVMRVVGAALLLAYAALAARRALHNGPASTTVPARRRVIAATLAFTWLNPAVYIDTLILLGTVANAHPNTRWSFGAGAVAASVSWFVVLGWAARLLTPVLGHRHAPRVLDAFVAAVMALAALRTLPL